MTLRWSSKKVLLPLLPLLLQLLFAAVSATDESSRGTPPPFFLQDPVDSLCLGGEIFKRCSIDTLFYVTGAPGNYQIHKRPLEEPNDQDDGICLSKKSCNEKDVAKVMEARLAKCSHCGAKNWNILGDADTGYVLTEGDGATCLVREKGSDRAMTAPCDSEDLAYVPLQLQFASAADITAMSSPAARLIGAASDGDKKQMQALLKEGIDVNIRDWDDLTALIPAASSGHLDICKLLVKEGCDVNAKDKDGITSLMEASIMGHNKVVEYLIDAGAEVDASANSGVTALWLAAGEGKVQVLKALLKKHADANNARLDGITAVMTASLGGHFDSVKVLLENGADPTAADNDGLTALMNAAENGTLPVVQALVEAAKEPKAYMNMLSSTGFNAITIAAAHGKSDVIEYLLETGADVNIMSENGVTPLMYAAAADHIDAMTVLIDKGKADLDAEHSNGGTALLEATTGGATKALKLLIEKGAKFDFLDLDGVSPLMAIASQGDFEGQSFLLENLKKTLSPDKLLEHINVASYSGGTAVMFAAAAGKLDCMNQLIEAGADIKAIAKATPDYLEKYLKMVEEGTVQEDDPHVDGVTALHVAAQGGHLDCVKALIKAGADVQVLDEEERSALLLAIKGNHAEVASELVQAGADPNTPFVDEDGTSHNLLMDAITVENEEFASLLIENDADLYYKDEKEVTTLLQASHRGLVGVTKLLLEKHATSGKKPGYLEEPSDEGISPMIAAASEGHLEVVKMLAAAGANVDTIDKDGTTAMMAAAARGHVEAVEALIEAGANINVQNTDGHTALMFAYNGKNQVETLWERYSQFVAENANEDGEATDDGGTGPIIREALDNHTALVDLLLQSGADANVKDKEGHKATDFDFHPDADADVLAKEAKMKKMRDGSTNEL